MVLNNEKKKSSIKTVSITQILPHSSLDDIRKGIEDVLHKKYGDNINIVYQTANGSIATAMQIARHFVSVESDSIVAISTPSTQSVVGVKTGKIPIIYAGVSNPSQSKISQKSYPYLTGVSDAPPLIEHIKLIKILLEMKDIKNGTVGILYSSSETNASSQAQNLSVLLRKEGLKVKLYSVNSSCDVAAAASAAINESQILYIGNDNSLISGIESVIRICKKHKKPLMVSDPQSVEKGALVSFAFDQFAIGQQAGNLVINALQGNILPIEQAKGAQLFINNEFAKQLNYDAQTIKKRFENERKMA